MTAWTVFLSTLAIILMFAAYFLLMFAGAFIACYIIGFVMGMLSRAAELGGWKRIVRSWNAIKDVAFQGHHNGIGFWYDVTGFKRHRVVVEVPYTRGS